ncbi:sulfite exporter TauE/SafE family protein, partial [Desulfovibrio sp. OttesenSCG-928-I05]|nr:sulfite exporter TauE/SafE family protein [Desulfovibrio sp. OttesenSCG-928-I05]
MKTPSPAVICIAAALLLSAGLLLYSSYGEAIASAWWFWPALLGVFCFFIGVLAVFAGIGGGVLFVPLAGAFFPFHLDFIRGTGLLIALAGA